MPYTLLKFLLWFGLAALIGCAIGWLLRSLKSRGEVAEARGSTVDDDELARMRNQLDDLEHVVAERDRLRIKVAELRAVEAADAGTDHGDRDDLGDDDLRTRASESAAPAPDDASGDAPSIMSDTDDDDAGADGSSGTTGSSHDAESSDDDDAGADGSSRTTGSSHDAESSSVGLTDVGDHAAGDGADESAAESSTDGDPSERGGGAGAVPPQLDLDAAAVVLGKKIAMDDLTVIEGIGPKILELCRGIRVETWRQLADTPVGDLRSMLDDAGPRYQVHKPDSWPAQAELLASGRWSAFKSMVDELGGGR